MLLHVVGERSGWRPWRHRTATNRSNGGRKPHILIVNQKAHQRDATSICHLNGYIAIAFTTATSLRQQIVITEILHHLRTMMPACCSNSAGGRYRTVNAGAPCCRDA